MDYCLHGLPYQIRGQKSSANYCTTEVAKCIVEGIVLKHGVPKEMINDHGRNILSNVLKNVNYLCQTFLRLITAYHPQTNELTERLPCHWQTWYRYK